MIGKFIVFEGVEGGGKTTQIELLQDWLLETGESRQILPKSIDLDLEVVITREPGGTKLGKALRELLLSPDVLAEKIQETSELLLYAADRAQHIEALIKPCLERGTIVLCDRFIDSTIAYQGYGRGLDVELIKQLNYIATGGLKSDLTFWLDIDVEIGLARAKSRGNFDRMEQANIEFHRRVQQGYQELAKNNSLIVRIDANLTREKVQQQIQAIIMQKLVEWKYI
ncbi:MAG: dTMP kinase [Trichodesmium sp. St16_bin4-tuft]|uniref:Thymidylate kinase n=1 Tax=Trichodesmium erythraeum (strain IMS101) TaxID=203124 RepID=KTHY_TRIEI|nr:RecName: Full=Thymidylate kinase; AltName: Full=dTMP kinase [Trichodesmium erythraeum IMS101]MBS9772413.1 dTMP kinase [Trichodesmium erythraeum GBRTRLIN201]MCH2048900.1 dTMP kinase [Trichodesmium sp. ALOHA_ZT_67]MCL2928644.1 dTMP kinase [Trichodesmium sp. MAG_R01]MDE5067701.1 dTMP kinase [Trichodesmium sp. St4_bin8_1]MDE5074296.1 dTMP kinase [Trichodesmium sp. St5_bin8]MDE5091831.1 dTMP kinase [Trichodesmium sp. St18_bin3_1_1]MDE5099445.1 dTMP kinase [Trichodesmium sp. St16_bin4-tuft]